MTYLQFNKISDLPALSELADTPLHIRPSSRPYILVPTSEGNVKMYYSYYLIRDNSSLRVLSPEQFIATYGYS